jgi:hypothetical protein
MVTAMSSPESPLPRRPCGPAQIRGLVGLGLGVLLAVALGCSRPEEPGPTSSAPVVEPVFPSLSAERDADGGAGAPSAPWMSGVPDVPVPVAIGKRAWAVTPVRGTELAQVAVYTVGHIDGHRATVLDAQGQRVKDVPGALVHPLGEPEQLRAGDAALAFSTVTAVVVGRVTARRGGTVQLQYDWAGGTRSMAADHAEPLVAGIAPMAFVGYPKFGRTSRGLVVALDAAQAWIQTSSGHIELHPRAKLEPIALPAGRLAAGDKVEAYGWTSGYERGTVARVLEPDLRYAIELPASRIEHPYFFADLRVVR